MDNPAGKITDSEYEVMKVLWDAGEPLPVTEIRRTLQEQKGWEATTVKTLVSRLTDKKAVLQEKRNVFYYRPAITEKEYQSWAAGSLISRLFRGSAKNLIAALVDSDDLSKNDIEELQQMFHVEE